MKILLIIFTLLYTCASYATSFYVSDIDKELTIKKITVSATTDNVNGIYSAPLGDELLSLIEKDKIWNILNSKTPPDSTSSFDDYLDNPNKSAQILKTLSSDGLIKLNILKGPQGVQIKLAFFTSSGKVFSLKEAYATQKQDIPTLKEELEKLYHSLVSDFPYQALVLSRSNNIVTINRGHNANINPDDEFNVVQIVSIERHPKFNFIINNQKEIIGKIHITKVEDTLSFGEIVFEKENLSLQQNMKVVLTKPVVHAEAVIGSNDDLTNEISKRKDAELMLGKSSEVWKPSHQPTFGKFAISLGLGNYQTTEALVTSGGVSGQSPLTLDMSLSSELWLTPTYFMQLDYDQGAVTFSNSLAGSTPSSLTFSLTKYDLLGGMNILLNDSYFGPKFQLLIGVANFQSSPNSSRPVAFTTQTFSGLSLGVKGTLPLKDGSPWTFGGESYLSLMPTTQETPVSSGNVDSTSVISFAGFSEYKLKENVNILNKIIMDSYSSNFSGTGTRTEAASNSTHQWLRLTVGMQYLF